MRASGAARGGLAAVLLGLLSAVAAGVAAPEPAKPRRIVSLNLCTDQLLLRLVEPERILSVNWRAADPHLSVMAPAAAGLALNHGTAEEVVALAPDLVLAGPGTRAATRDLLAGLRYRVVVIDIAADLAGVRRQIRETAAAVGESERGARLIAEMDRRLAAASPPPTGRPRPLAAVYEANGGTAGPGSLLHDLLLAAGFDNMAARLGMRGFALMPLETLILARPAVIVAVRGAPDAPSVAHAVLDHPALAAATPAQAITLPMPLLICPGPWTAEAVERLAAGRAALEAGTRP